MLVVLIEGAAEGQGVRGGFLECEARVGVVDRTGVGGRQSIGRTEVRIAHVVARLILEKACGNTTL